MRLSRREGAGATRALARTLLAEGSLGFCTVGYRWRVCVVGQARAGRLVKVLAGLVCWSGCFGWLLWLMVWVGGLDVGSLHRAHAHH